MHHASAACNTALLAAISHATQTLALQFACQANLAKRMLICK